MKIEHWGPCKELLTHEQAGLVSLVLSRSAQATGRFGVGNVLTESRQGLVVLEEVILLGNAFDFVLGSNNWRHTEQGWVLLLSLSGPFLPRMQPLSLRLVKAFATKDASLHFERRKGYITLVLKAEHHMQPCHYLTTCELRKQRFRLV